MNLNLLLKQDENRPGDGMRSLQLLPYAYADNVSGFGPVVNADVYNAMIAESPWYNMGITPQETIKQAQKGSANLGSLPSTESNYNYKELTGPWGLIHNWQDFPRTKTEKGYLSANDLNTITKIGIPSEYTEVFTNDKIPNYTVTENQLAAMKYGSAGPVADAEEYEDIKKRADKTAKKKLTFRDLVLKSKGIE